MSANIQPDTFSDMIDQIREGFLLLYRKWGNRGHVKNKQIRMKRDYNGQTEGVPNSPSYTHIEGSIRDRSSTVS